MAIVKTTAPGEEFPGKKNPKKDVQVKTARSAPQMKQGVPTGSGKSFIQDTITELKRVVWPSQEERIAGTIVTIGLLIFFSLYIFGLDRLITVLFNALNLPT
jgi:preprotein translocase SecE subunit